VHTRARPVFFRAGVFLGTAIAATGCAARAVPATRVDLSPAREALESARLLNSAEEASDCFVKAEGHLNEAESLAATRDPEKTRQAEWLARLSLVESHCATSIARIVETLRAVPPVAAPVRTDETRLLKEKLQKAEGDQRKLEERVAVLQRTLEVTETEVVRAKAKLKGIETKAEASSAIAEARILMRRLQEEKGRSDSLNMSQDRLDSAVEQLQNGDYSLAAFYALQAQEILEQVRRGVRVTTDPERAAVKKQYVVQATSANIRKTPSRRAELLGTVPNGAVLEALTLRNEWVKVKHEGLEGWVLRSLLE
jgi:hypothetical protein